MFRGIVEQVAALAQRFKIAGRAVAGVMIKVCASQHDLRDPDGS